MTKTEILDEIARLPRPERRDIVNEILGMEPDAIAYGEATQSAEEAFLLLDAMEAEDAEGSKSG